MRAGKEVVSCLLIKLSAQLTKTGAICMTPVEGQSRIGKEMVE